VRLGLRIVLQAAKVAALGLALSAGGGAYAQNPTAAERALPPPRTVLAHLEQLQPVLLRSEATGLLPHRKGETDIYAIGVSGWATLEVFAKEVDGGLTAIGKVLPIADRTMRLINNAETAAHVPLATPRNFEAAVHDVAGLMDRENDILILFLTSHGDRNGVALQLPDRIVDLTPKEVAATFKREGIKNRVVIVSACFSGIFVPPLQSPNTIVMTAADATHTSFGCAPERDWTYFGDAFFRQALLPGTNFQNAFDHARILIRGWELMDHAPPSNPQGSFGPALVAKLAPFFASPPKQAGQ
jgi:Peptidase C13 family